MKLDEIMPIEKWVELEKEINRKSGLNAAVFDAAGVRITDFKKWTNRLCPAIRETGKGLKFICKWLILSGSIEQVTSMLPRHSDIVLLVLIVPSVIMKELAVN
jgi:hypothetical protein